MTLAGDALVRFSDALYLIFKLAVVLWQSFDHDIRSVRRVQGTYKEQTLTDLKFVLGHNVARRDAQKLQHPHRHGPAVLMITLRRAALWGLGGPPFCKPFGKCFVSGYRALEARLLVSFEAGTAALQQPLPTLRQTQPKFTVGFVSSSRRESATFYCLLLEKISLVKHYHHQ